MTVETGAGWRLRLDLDTRSATYRGVDLADPEFVHPGLAATAAIVSRSRGHEAFHAGAIAVDGRAWGVIGDREAGKTSLLAAMSAMGVEVLADDLVVVSDGQVYAGPRCLDLREPLTRDLPTTAVRHGLRYRLTLPGVPATTPLAGWIFLRWGARQAVDECPLRDRLRLLADAASWLVQPQDPVGLLEAAALPGLIFTRPRDRDRLALSAEDLLARLRPVPFQPGGSGRTPESPA